MSDAKSTLKQWCDDGKLSAATLSTDGASLSLDGASLNGKEVITVSSAEGKSVDYSVASIYLQILDPDQGLVKYRGACKKHQVGDPVKALDKPIVVGFFLAATAAAAPSPPEEATAAAAPEAPAEAAAVKPTPTTPAKESSSSKDGSASAKKPRPSSSSSKHHHDKHRRDRDHHHKKRPPSKDKHGDKHRKKHKPMVTNEQLFSNLNVVVDKRAGAASATATSANIEEETQNQKPVEDAEMEAIRKALSPEGFQVTPELLEKHKETTEQLMANEIPVGDSASILRASSAGANLTRVLTLFLETVNPKLAHKKGGSSPTSTPIKKNSKPYLIGKKPVILLPKGMTCPITIMNGFDFFSNARFIPRDVMMKNKQMQANAKKTAFTRKMPGVGLVEFELLDNPRKLSSKEDWERVVAVVVLGHKWQFKDWPGRYSDPVQLFSKTFGFYIGMEGDKLPKDLVGWACKQGKVHRDKRGLDSVTYASFWNSLDEWIKIHKSELLPHPE